MENKNGKGSELGLKHRKSQFSEWFSEIISKAELADLRYNVKGFLVHRPWSTIALKEMYKLYEAELEKKGHEPVIFPAVIPAETLKKESEHVEGFAPEVFWVTETGNGNKLTEKIALRPTSETAMYQMYSIWIRSWRDLPLKLYQSNQVWRYETKATRPFIRGREFYWIEAHDVFTTKEGAEKQVLEDMDTTEKVMHREFGVPFIFFQRPEWDKFAGAVNTYAADSLMPDGKVIQQPSTHLLGQNFSKPFNIRFTDKDKKERHAWQTCYGPAIWRIFASVIALHGDDRGLMFPFKIAPVQVMIIPITTQKTIIRKCKDIKEELEKEGLKARVDDSENNPGWKFNQWEMKGVPIRLEIGPKEVKNKQATLVRRDTGKREIIQEKNVLEEVLKSGEELTRNLKRKADKWFKKNIHNAKNMKELEHALKKGGFVRASFCSIDRKGEPCADVIKEKLHGDVRGIRIDIKEKSGAGCVVCGKKAGCVVYIGRQY